eukprot:scaffold8733_cov52-Attheya_sp.AAC.1
MMPTIPTNKRKCSRDEAVPDSEGASKSLQTKQSQNLEPSHQREELDEDGNVAATIQPLETMNGNESLEVPEDQRVEFDRQREAETQVTKSGRKSQPARRLMEAMATEIEILTMDDMMGETFCISALYPDDDQLPGSEDQSILAYKASADPDTMYIHKAMKEPDRGEFIKAMLKEVKDQMNNVNFSIVHKSTVKDGKKILPTVWHHDPQGEEL